MDHDAVSRPVHSAPDAREDDGDDTHRAERTPEETVGAILLLASGVANYLLCEIIEVYGGLLMK